MVPAGGEHLEGQDRSMLGRQQQQVSADSELLHTTWLTLFPHRFGSVIVPASTGPRATLVLGGPGPFAPTLGATPSTATSAT